METARVQVEQEGFGCWLAQYQARMVTYEPTVLLPRLTGVVPDSNTHNSYIRLLSVGSSIL
jgi:hypothetical protein